jgi:glucose/arabinose dehydrogenase
MKSVLCMAAMAAALLTSTAMVRADNLDTLGKFKVTGASGDMPQIPQTGPKVDGIKKTLATKVKLPAGFKISLYAMVPDARQIAVSPNGVATFVSTRKQHVYALTDRGKAGFADDVKLFAASLDMQVPHGVCFSKDGFLYIAERNRVIVYPAAEYFYEGNDVVAVPIVKQGELIPVEEESYNHTARICRVGPDDRLYISLGQPFNVPSQEKFDLYSKIGIGGILSMKRDGSDRQVYTTGIRNSVGMDFNPKDKTLWFTDNQVDGMGDTIPAGELNRQTKAGQNFGFPYYGGGKTRTDDYKNATPPADIVFPQIETDAHAADLGMNFYKGAMFPKKYQNAIFSVQHGSWNRVDPRGARIMVTTLKEDGSADKMEVFADGWLQDTGEYLGRPVDVAPLKDGSLLVSDDLAGAVYRITYGN